MLALGDLVGVRRLVASFAGVSGSAKPVWQSLLQLVKSEGCHRDEINTMLSYPEPQIGNREATLGFVALPLKTAGKDLCHFIPVLN